MTLSLSKKNAIVVMASDNRPIAVTLDHSEGDKFAEQTNKALRMVGVALVTQSCVPLISDDSPRVWAPSEVELINVINYLRDDEYQDKTYNGTNDLMKRIVAYCHDRRAR